MRSKQRCGVCRDRGVVSSGIRPGVLKGVRRTTEKTLEHLLLTVENVDAHEADLTVGKQRHQVVPQPAVFATSDDVVALELSDLKEGIHDLPEGWCVLAIHPEHARLRERPINQIS